MTSIVLADSFWKGVEPDTEALVEKWLVTEGERVAKGQVIGSAMLVKASCELTAPAAGVIERILVPPEQTFRRGEPLATLCT